MKKYPYTTIDEDKIGGFNYGNRGDQFYTQEKNIVSELSNYDLKGKIIYCNCDRPTVSNFYKFFKNNFNDLGLKGLYASYYDDNPFSDSMATELIRMAKKYGKHVIIVGPNTIASQKEMFDMIKNNQLNMGYTTINRFNTPSGEKKTAPTSWWTTMETNKPFFKTGVKYNPSNYQKLDNFDAIDIVRFDKDLPDDYYGYMAVSPRFLRVLNRNQFDIITKIRPIINGKTGFEKYIIKRKPQQQVNNDVIENITNKVCGILIEKLLNRL